MRRLSGDQWGRRLPGDQWELPSIPLKELTWVGLDPSRSHTQISRLPERRDSKAMCLPSGETCGFNSPRLEEIILAGPAVLVGLVSARY
jgi:hypothetical protein